jgi:hypothetical protein
VWKKEIDQTLTHMQISMFVEKRFYFSMIFTVNSHSLVGIQNVSAALEYTIPDSGKNVLLIVLQGILSQALNHNLLSTIQLRLHDVIVNETLKFQYLNLTNLSHSISVRGDNVDYVLVITLDLNGVVSCLLTFKPTQQEFEKCDRYDLTYEFPECDPSAKTFHDQDVVMMYSWGNIKLPGEFHPKRRQVCPLRQKEA